MQCLLMFSIFSLVIPGNMKPFTIFFVLYLTCEPPLNNDPSTHIRVLFSSVTFQEMGRFPLFFLLLAGLCCVSVRRDAVWSMYAQLHSSPAPGCHSMIYAVSIVGDNSMTKKHYFNQYIIYDIGGQYAITGFTCQNTASNFLIHKKKKVHCLPLVTGLCSKLVFNLAEHHTLLQ